MKVVGMVGKLTGTLLRMPILTYCCLLLVAAALRFYRLDAQSLWYDEAFSAIISGYDLPTIAARTALDTMPPLYYWLVHLVTVVFPDDFGVRLTSAISGVAAVALVYGLGRALFNEKVALFASSLAAVSPFQVYYSQEARMYTLLGALQMAATLCFVLALKGKGWLYWAGFSTFAALALYTHNMAVLYFSALVMPYLLLLAAGFLRPSSLGLVGVRCKGFLYREQSRGFLGSLGLTGLLFLPWLTILPSQIARVQASFWDTNFSPLKVLATFYLFIMNSTLGGWIFALGLFLFVLVTILALTGAWKTRKTTQNVQQLALVVTLLLVPMFLLALVSLIRPLYLERVLIGSSYAFYLLLGWWLVDAAPRALALVCGALIVIVVGAGLFSWYFMPEYWKPPMREAAEYLAEGIQPGDGVLHSSDGSYRPIAWYEPGLPQYLLSGDPELKPGSPRFQSSMGSLGVEPVAADDFMRKYGRIWLVVALDHSADWQLQQKKWFDENTRAVSQVDLKGIEILLYESGRDLQGSG